MINSGFSKILTQAYEIQNLEPIFKEYPEVDDFCINKEKIWRRFLVLEKLMKKPVTIEVNQNLLLSSSTLIWTHSNPRDIIEFALQVPLRFYLIRDGRDVVNSFIHHTCRKSVMELSGYKIANPKEVYKRLDIFEKYVKLWNSHIKEYLKFRELFIEIRFENLVNFGKDFLLILQLFQLKEETEWFKAQLRFSKLKSENREHLRKGQTADWKNFFTEKHKDIFKEIAGETLIQLGYESDFKW